MSQQTLDISRVQKYVKLIHNLNIYDEFYGKYFRINDDLTFSLWVFDFSQPDILQLRIDYPDAEIKADIALIQLRAYRNLLLSNSDKLVTVDYPFSESKKNDIKIWRQMLRDIPETIDPILLTIDETGRFDRSLIPEVVFSS